MELAPVCGNTSSTLLGGVLTTFCSMSVDICAHLAKITFVRSGTENGRENLVVSWVYWTSHSKTIGINMELLPIVAISTSTLLGRNILEWIFECAHLTIRTFVRSGTDDEWENLAGCLSLLSIPFPSDGHQNGVGLPLLLWEPSLCFEGFPQDFVCIWGSLCPFSQKSRYCCWMTRPGSKVMFWFIPKVFLQFLHNKLLKPSL